jgi:hypothetical protein
MEILEYEGNLGSVLSRVFSLKLPNITKICE